MTRLARSFPSHPVIREAPLSNYTVNLSVVSPTSIQLQRFKTATLAVATATVNVLTAIKIKAIKTLSVASATTDTLSTRTGRGMIMSVTSSTVSNLVRAIRKRVSLGDTPAVPTYSTDVLASNPNQYWRFQEIGDNSNVCYDSAEGFFMVTAGGVTKGIEGLVAGLSTDFGLMFDGGTGGASCGIPTGMFQGNDFSVEFWMYPFITNASKFVMAVGLIGSAGVDNFLHIGAVTSQKLRFGFFGDDLDSTQTLIPFNKYHVVCTWQASTNAKNIYINGALDTAAFSSGTFNVLPGASMQVGKVDFGGGNGPFYYGGQVSQLALYPTVLSAATIAQHYTDGITGPTFVGPSSISTVSSLTKGVGKSLGTTLLLTPKYVLRSRLVVNNFDGGLSSPLSATVLPEPIVPVVQPGIFRASPPKGTIKVQFRTFIQSIIRRVGVS